MQEHQHEPYQQPPTEQREHYQQPSTEQERERYQQMSEQQREQYQQTRAQQEAQAQQQAQQQARQAEQQAKEQLFTPDQRNQFDSRWKDIQIEFVSDPRKSVEDADRLVGEMTQTLEKQLNDRSTKLEQEWQQGKPSTEDLRVALEHYRSFFDRLLSI